MRKNRTRETTWLKILCAVMMLATLLTGQLNSEWIVKAAIASQTNSQGIVDFGEGNASITLNGNQGQSLTGKTLYLYKLFDVKNAVGLEGVNYTFNPVYEEALKTVVGEKLNKTAANVTEYEVIDYMSNLSTYEVEGAQADQELEGSYSEYRYFVEELLQEIHQQGLRGEEIHVAGTREDNSIKLTGLAYGYYLVEDDSEAEGKHTAVSLAMLTTANKESTVNIKADYPTVTKKIQEDDNQTGIGADGWNDIGDFEIGQDVPYRYQSNIPNMNGYHTYYYAWHDVMDEALTLQEDSIQIIISGTVDSTEKEYQLKETEYRLLTEVENETFVIEIDDIKAIVDREFDQKNSGGENVYNQSVTVTYKATLNDKAAEKTGRSGFENDVRLEFSNDPNSTGEGKTGFTPWDTVVCFTYKINGLKVNNYGTKLEGATFRLYRDEKCAQEVYVKKAGDGYHVMHEDVWKETTPLGGIPTGATSMVSEADGVFNIYGLDGGIYYLKEESAPEGYRVILDPIKIQITSVFTENRNVYEKGDGAGEDVLKLTASAHIITFVDGEEKEEDVVLGSSAENGSINLSVVNEIGKKLPITGSYFMPVLTGAGVLLMGAAVLKGRKKHE